MAIKWHNVIYKDHSKLPNFIDHFEKELEEAKKEIKVHGSIEVITQSIPAYHETRHSQLQEVEAVLEVLELHLKKISSEKFKKFLESYHKALSSADCMKYVNGDADVVDISEMINEVRFIRNKYLGIVKSLEQLGYAMGYVVKLRVAGIEDARLN